MTDPSFPPPSLAAQRLQALTQARAQPLDTAVQRWLEHLRSGRWTLAERVLQDHPALVRVELPIDEPGLSTHYGAMLALERADLEWGALPRWALTGVDWHAQSPAGLSDIAQLLRSWHRLGGRWHGTGHGPSASEPLLNVLGAHHAHIPGLWTTLLHAGWPAAEQGWVLHAVLHNPDGDASARRLRTCLSVLDADPTLLLQQGPDGQTAWHLLMTSLPGRLNDTRRPLAEQLVERLLLVEEAHGLSRTPDDQGRRPVDLFWPEVDASDPTAHEAQPDFPYWMLLQWLRAQGQRPVEPDLWSLWQRQVDLDRPMNGASPVVQAFAARLEQESLTRLDLQDEAPSQPLPRRRM